MNLFGRFTHITIHSSRLHSIDSMTTWARPRRHDHEHSRLLNDYLSLIWCTRHAPLIIYLMKGLIAHDLHWLSARPRHELWSYWTRPMNTIYDHDAPWRTTDHTMVAHDVPHDLWPLVDLFSFTTTWCTDMKVTIRIEHILWPFWYWRKYLRIKSCSKNDQVLLLFLYPLCDISIYVMMQICELYTNCGFSNCNSFVEPVWFYWLTAMKLAPSMFQFYKVRQYIFPCTNIISIVLLMWKAWIHFWYFVGGFLIFWLFILAFWFFLTYCTSFQV